ncbi:hypothetical protein [Actinophytocola sp.]|uniref:RCC1 domain-containing protein n=1 Tax=Actinophytocola sp. TaxID=1872138 RepID=UPI002ED09A98
MLSTVLTAALTAGLLLAGSPTHAEPAPTAAPQRLEGGSTFSPRSPVRVLDTRDGAGPVGAGGVHTLDLSGYVPTTTTAVVLNVTGVTPTAPTHISVYPSGTGPATVSNLNLPAGDIRANQVTVKVNADRKVDLYNNSGSIDLVVDLAGHYSTGAGAKYTALPPDRRLDTRDGNRPVGPDGTLVLDLANRIPASATAVTFNLTATGGTASTFVTAWPTGTNRPTASNLNLPAGDTRPNLVTVAVGADRKVNLSNLAGSLHLIVDLAGFYTPEYGAYFLPLDPTRLLDTRSGIGGHPGPLGQRSTLDLEMAQWSPATVTGAVLNVTGVDATTPTFVSAWSMWDPQPLYGSILNPAPGQAVPNAAVVAYGTGLGIKLYNQNGSVHLIADLAGVFAVEETACQADCVYAWGRNDHRRLGTAEVFFDELYPTQAVGLSGVREVAASYENGYALRTDGTVLAWGLNSEGQLGNGWLSWSGGGSVTPAPVVGLTDVTAITAASGNGYALRADGTVWAWGSNTYGKLGIGPTLDDATVPVRVSGLTDVVAISGRLLTTYALRADGTVWAWGHNVVGALGNGSTVEESPVPVQVSGLTGVTAIAARGWGGFALRADGTVWGWGQDNVGQLGDGQPCPVSGPCESRVPVQVTGLTGVTAIAGGPGNGYAVRDDGTAWAWGQGSYNELGDGEWCDLIAGCASQVPVRVANLSTVTSVASAEFGGYALLEDGTVWAWGTGALGTGEHTSAVPVPVEELSGVGAISGGFYSGHAVVP